MNVSVVIKLVGGASVTLPTKKADSLKEATTLLTEELQTGALGVQIRNGEWRVYSRESVRWLEISEAKP